MAVLSLRLFGYGRSPTLTRSRSARWSAVLFAMLLVAGLLAVPVELSLMRWLRDHPPRGDMRRFIALCEAFGYVPTVALIILTAGVLDARGRRVVYRLALSAFGAGAAANLVKAMIARQRPLSVEAASAWNSFCGWLPVWRLEHWSHATQSFPSAHTATAVGLALAVAYPRGRGVFALLAVLVGLQRVLAQAHFPSDVLFGAALAVLVHAVCEYGWPQQAPDSRPQASGYAET
jgi:membrane-associated phospholipid phosphatase